MKAITWVSTAAFFLLSIAVASAEPLVWYTFDEPSGDALDTGDAPAANAMLLGGATRSANTPGGFGSSLDLRDDANTYAHAVAGDVDKLDGLGALTLTTWLNVESYPSGNHRLLAKQAAGTFGGFSWNMNATPNDGVAGPDNFRLGIFLGNNVSAGGSDFGAGFSSADVDADNKWVFLAVTYDSSLATDNTRFYIGDAENPVTQLGAPLTLPQLTVDGGNASFGIGFTDAAPTADTSVIGYQDDVRVYGSALSAAELDAVRQQAIPEPGTIAIVVAAGAFGLLLRRGA